MTQRFPLGSEPSKYDSLCELKFYFHSWLSQLPLISSSELHRASLQHARLVEHVGKCVTNFPRCPFFQKKKKECGSSVVNSFSQTAEETARFRVSIYDVSNNIKFIHSDGALHVLVSSAARFALKQGIRLTYQLLIRRKGGWWANQLAPMRT